MTPLSCALLYMHVTPWRYIKLRRHRPARRSGQGAPPGGRPTSLKEWLENLAWAG